MATIINNVFPLLLFLPLCAALITFSTCLFDLIPLTGWIFPLIKCWQHKRIPEIAKRQAAGIEIFFR